MTTERLYYEDPFLLTFQARVVARRSVAGQPALILDRTAFYPTSGGQPHDRGTLDGVPVLDVQEESGQIVHVVAGDVPAEIVQGHVDRQRRFDHMQQHTGQHILSQAFVEQFDAETISFHLSEDYASIDLDRSGFSREDLDHLEDRANEIVFQDLPVVTRFVTPAELADLPLRKPPTEHERIRIVEVQGFDWSACGGTHCRRTGQVGLIRITQSERRGEETRITFLCGWRALHNARWEHDLLVDLAAPFSVGLPDLPDAIARLSEAEEHARKGLERARQALLGYEAAERYQAGEQVGPARVVRALLVDRSLEQVRLLAREIAAKPGGIALLGLEGGTARICFARAEDLPGHMGQLVREAAGVIGGRGGGRPEEAQGGGPQADRLEEALDVALARLRELLGEGEE